MANRDICENSCKCGTCKYTRQTEGILTCDYILITSKKRGCPAGDECVKYERKEKK